MAIKPYFELVRLPNVFTAAADSLAGWLLVTGSFSEPDRWVPLVLASACTYAGGIVLNDVFDYQVDRVERPERPLPSGRVGRKFAGVLAVVLLGAGFCLAAVSYTFHGRAVETALIGFVLGYNINLKQFVVGPEVMGACRGLNLLLGMSIVPGFGGPMSWTVALAYAAFVTGVTWISRSEVETGKTRNIKIGLGFQFIAFVGLLVACAGAESFPVPEPRSILRVLMGVAALTFLGVFIGRKTVHAINNPRPTVIQDAVKSAILSLVWIHVGVLLAVRGPLTAVAVGLLWFPARWVGRWIYST